MDCMDWSDENEIPGSVNSIRCFGQKTTIDCDEHICRNNLWSCGDGQCIDWHERFVFQNFLSKTWGCQNLRNFNHMCELNTITDMWTLSTGLCWVFINHRYDDPRLSMNNPDLSDEEKCIYLIRCILSNGFELDCPCNRLNCSNLMSNVCQTNDYYAYPKGHLIRPYVHTYFKWTNDFKDQIPHKISVFGNIRCRGFNGHYNISQNFLLIPSIELISTMQWDSLICSSSRIIRNESSSAKYDDDCWKDSFTFNNRPYAVYNICTTYHQCISQYRINDGWKDCLDNHDENNFNINGSLCSRVRQHRFQCSIEQPTCLTILSLANTFSQCSNGYDEYLYGHGLVLSELLCQKSRPDNCKLFKEYVKNSSLMSNSYSNIYQSMGKMSFRSYCDSFWNLPKHVDELKENCENWICHQDQYQCKTGQCIPLEWVCDGQWDCADASDEEAILSIHYWSLHNANLSGLNERCNKCLQDYLNISFSEFCDTKKEFPCLRPNISNPVNLKQDIHCISYSKIGDEIEDCYNAYDEKNTFQIDGRMWGFAFRCANQSMVYPYACAEKFNECAQLFCSYQYYQLSDCQKSTDAVCISDKRCVPGGRCDKKRDCLYGEDEYWCPSGQHFEQLMYRHDRNGFTDNHIIFYQQIYPQAQSTADISPTVTQSLLSNPIKISTNPERSQPVFSFWCNKGVSTTNYGRVVCFCPPSYFGEKCQFFSDRITIVTHINLKTWPSLSIPMPTIFKIKVNFLFNEIIMDHYEFYSNTIFEIHNPVKHKFYLLYSRSTQMLSYKQTRFYNRTDIEKNHPFSVHFDIYALNSNQSTPTILGTWHYPIYFDFLPSFRFGTILNFPNWLRNSNLSPCMNHTCNENSTCQPIFNQNNSYVCVCNSGFYGKNCCEYDDTCTSYCSPYSFCRPNDRSMIYPTRNPFCICPLEHFGPRCYLKFQQCDMHPCMNNGSCVYMYESYTDGLFVCICSELFYGDRCQYQKMAIQVQFNTSTILELPRASTIQFYDVNPKTLELILQRQQIIEGFPTSVFYAHGLETAPPLGILKTHYDSIEPRYFIFYIQPNSSSINIPSSSPQHCPFASTLLKKSKFV